MSETNKPLSEEDLKAVTGGIIVKAHAATDAHNGAKAEVKYDSFHGYSTFTAAAAELEKLKRELKELKDNEIISVDEG